MTYSIYALIDPRTNQERYIGLTRYPHSRLIQHKCISRPRGARGKWVAELKRLGLSPEMRILETIDVEHDAEIIAMEREQYWIDEFLRLGFSLLNIEGVTASYRKLPSYRYLQTGKMATTLEEYRRLLSWSQTDLAREAGLNNQTVGSAEKGERISARTAQSICKALSQALGKAVLAKDIEGLNVRI